MKSLDSRVNLIPIVAKSDTMTKTELDRFREIVLQELNSYGIQYYRFPINDQIVGRDNIETNVNLLEFNETMNCSLLTKDTFSLFRNVFR